MAKIIPNSYDHSGIGDKGVLAPPSIIYNGRTETYTHSDMTTANKGSCIVRIDCKTEFGAKTDAFISFCKRAAMLCYGAQSEIYTDVIVMFPELEQARLDLEGVLKEKIAVKRIVIVTLLKDVWEKEKPIEILPLAERKRIKFPLFEIADKPDIPFTSINEVRFDPIKKDQELNDGWSNR
jgi:hypothetical protein